MTEHVTDHYLCSAQQDSSVTSNITNHVVTQNLLDDRQRAYREGKSTEQLVKHLTERRREAIEMKLFVGILFVDLAKTFDTVSHNILLQKLNDLGIRGDIWLWLTNYRHRKKTIRQNQPMRLRYTHYNSWSAAKVGPQTHVLSFFTNDLLKSLLLFQS